MKQLSEPLLKEIEGYINDHQPEFFWDYRDSLSHDQIAKLATGNADALGEIEDGILSHNHGDGHRLIREAEKDIRHRFKPRLKAEMGKGWKKAFKQWISGAGLICVGTNIRDLIKNTHDQVFFYDTGTECSGDGNTGAQYRLDRYKIKKTLSITGEKYDKTIGDMQCNASYGGRLVVYFYIGIDALLDMLQNENANTIKFVNASVAIIDTCGGSGSDAFLHKHTFSLPFIRENLFFERSVHYNYTYEVCGMSSDWCDSTLPEVLFVEGTAPINVTVSPINAQLGEQAKFDATFRSGKCTFGDMDIKRHRNVNYDNNFPCGNRCRDCSTFWID